MTGVYNPLTGENWNTAEAQAAWNGSMERARSERTASQRWQLHGTPGRWRWVFFNFGPWTGCVRVTPAGFCWETRSYDTGAVVHEGTTTSLYEAYQSVEQNREVHRVA